MLEWNDYLRMIIGLFAVVGPVSTVPLFLAYTDDMKSKRKRVARTAGIAVALILGVSVLAGSRILQMFSISIDGFRVAGGLLLLTIAFEMLHARTGRIKHTPEEDQEAMDSDSVAVVPLALPLLAGPGAISTVILFAQQSEAIVHKLVLVGVSAMMGLAVWGAFYLAPQIARRISQTAMNVSTRVMGLILAAM